METASPGKIILMLFDGALKFIATAKVGFGEADARIRNETINNNVVKARNIVLELQASLDRSVGGEFAQKMFELYDYMYAKLNEANVKKELNPLEDVESKLMVIRDAWNEMLTKGETTEVESNSISCSA